MSEPWGGLYEFSANEELNAKIKEIEEEYGLLVYAVLHGNYEFGECYSLLYVPKQRAEWNNDKDELLDGWAMAYVWNKSVDYCSEFGSIGVSPLFGGLRRVA